MFGRKKEQHKKRSSFLPFVIFRTFLSLAMFVLLLGGAYSAFQHFSGVDPLKGDPKAIIANLLNQEDIQSILQKTPVGEVSGFLNSKGVNVPQPQVSGESADNPTGGSLLSAPKRQDPPVFRFLLVADSHNENNNLRKAINQAKSQGIDLIIGLGDYTEIGTTDELLKAKQELDASGIRYFVTAGDHDLWDARDKQKKAFDNFVNVFGYPYQTFTYQNVKFIIVYNSDNYLGLGSEQLDWLNLELDRAKQESNVLTFALMHEPLYHPSSDRVMGKTEANLKTEAQSLIKLFKNSGVAEVFAGDIHFFTRYEEPQTGLKMTTVGSSASLRNVQSPRFALVSVFNDGGYEVEDIEIK